MFDVLSVNLYLKQIHGIGLRNWICIFREFPYLLQMRYAFDLWCEVFHIEDASKDIGV